MKRLTITAALAALLILILPPSAQSKMPMKHKAVTVTGCLAQGDEANEFSIIDSSGKVFGLFSSGGVNLKEHLGHKVTVTGTPTKEKESKAQEKKEAKTGQPEESEHLRVSSLKMVSTSCQ